MGGVHRIDDAGSRFAKWRSDANAQQPIDDQIGRRFDSVRSRLSRNAHRLDGAGVVGSKTAGLGRGND